MSPFASTTAPPVSAACFRHRCRSAPGSPRDAARGATSCFWPLPFDARSRRSPSPRDGTGRRPPLQRRVRAVGQFRGDHGGGPGGGLAGERARADGRGAGGGSRHDPTRRGRDRGDWRDGVAARRGRHGRVRLRHGRPARTRAVDGHASRAEGRPCRPRDRRRGGRPADDPGPHGRQAGRVRTGSKGVIIPLWTSRSRLSPSA
jgi:hypothetical protein